MSDNSKLIFRNTKSYIGEHDFAKPFCMAYCTKNKLHCPFIQYLKEDGAVLPIIRRWIDVEMSGAYNLQSVNGDKSQFEDERGSQFSCFCDGSGFEYDLMQSNVIGPNSAMETVYDFFQYGIETQPLQFSSWNTWLDKYQYDYRFGRVSDQNATTVMFPNVDNPWMMTEYVFKGTGKMYDIQIDADDPGDDEGYQGTVATQKNETEIVIQPPLYDPDTFALLNGDIEIEDSNAFDAKYKGLDHTSNSYYRQFRRLENWDKFNGNKDRQNNGNWSGIDAGVKLYKANVNVQCIKWGEHGNIPPHTINMTAPADYLDPTKSVAKIRPVWTMHCGSPLHANMYGVIGWQDRFAYIVEGIPEFTPHYKNQQVDYYTYETHSNSYYKHNGRRQDNPPDLHNSLMGMQYTAQYLGDNDIVHGGCKYLKAKGGQVRCEALDKGLLSNSANFNPSKCTIWNDENPICSEYVTSQEFPVIAAYEHKATNMSEYYASMGYLPGTDAANLDKANRLLNQSTGLPLADAFTAAGGYSLGRMIKPEQYTPDDEQTWYTLDYEIQNGALEQPQVKGSMENFGRNVQIVPGTGKYAIDTRQNANVFKGDDTNVYGDISTLNFHRFFSSIMHCATQADCNPVCGLTQSWGYEAGEKAGGAGKCRYYKEKIGSGPGCPTSCVPKRALEFGEVMQDVSLQMEQFKRNYNELVVRGIWCLTDIKNSSRWIVGESVNFYLQGGKIHIDNYWFQHDAENNDAILIGVNSKDDFKNLGNVYKEENDDIIIGKLQLAQKSNSNTITMYEEIGDITTAVAEKNVYRLAQSSYFWYEPLTDSGNKLTKTSYHHVDSDGHWFCKSDTSFVIPTYNCIIVDNDKKFIGGYHPQYKDYGQRGEQFMQEVEDPNDEFERENNAIGDRAYNHVPVVVNKKGYWIDESGLWITEELDIGLDSPIVNDKARKEPTSPGSICISIRKSNTETDNTTGMSKSPKTINAAVFANDPYDLVVTKFNESRKWDDAKQKFQGRPMLDGDDETYLASVWIKEEKLLPTMRKALFCPVCDYYIAYEYKTTKNVCPWCGTEYTEITGDEGKGLDVGDVWNKNASVIKKFFKLRAIGQVQMWGPPGTCVHTDAYFWKNQNHISNGMKRQIYHRLGNSNKIVGGGGWRFDQMSPQSEITLGYPQSLGKYVSIPDKLATNVSINEYRYGKLPWGNDIDKTMLGTYAMWNDISPEKYIPEMYTKGNPEDEGLISPYSEDMNTSLKMISYDQMRVLRNALQPMLAYTSEQSSQLDFPVLRASFDKRQERDQLIVYNGKRATVDPIILATTDTTGDDAYVEYNSGDLAIGNVREFYPNGYTWWFMKQVIGGRYSTLDGGRGHMEGGNGEANASWPNTNRTVAKCAMFIHGMLPLDKEIVKAYIVIPPGNSKMAYKQPIGRQWTGGHILYWHYHPMTTKHTKKKPVDGVMQDVAIYGQDGQTPHLHGNAGFGKNGYFDDNGLFYDNEADYRKRPGQGREYPILDESRYQNWGISNTAPDEVWSGWYDFDAEQITNIPIMYDVSFYSNVGMKKTPIVLNDNVLGYGYDDTLNSEGWQPHNITTANKSKERYQYIYLDSNSDICQQYTEQQIWKTHTRAEINEEIGKSSYNAYFSVSDGEDEIGYTFTETQSDLFHNYIPKQKQQIPGYFDMSWAHTSNELWGEYTVDENRSQTYITQETILQDDDSAVADIVGEYRGTNAVKATGKIDRPIDVTNIVKKLYNDRIKRQFHCKAGSTITQVYNYKYEETKTAGTLEQVDDDILKVIKARNAEDLLDKHSFPELNDGEIPPIDDTGDKYPLAPKTLQIRCEIPQFPYNITQTHYDVIFDYGSNSESLSGSVSTSYDNMEQVISQLSKIFKKFEIKQESQQVAVITPGKDSKLESVTIIDIPFGIPAKSYYFEQSRVVEVNSYVKNYHPNNLFNQRQWHFEDYSPQAKYVVIDLASVPICLEQRDYRYRAGSVNYSSCNCPNEMCKANQIPVAQAASLHEKRFNSSSNKCPLCGEELDTSKVISTPPDGIMTYTYDKPFHPDPIIKSIKIVPRRNMAIKTRQVTTVSVRHEGSNFWKTLIYQDDSNSSSWSNEITDTNDLERARFVKIECTVEPVEVEEKFKVNTSKYNSNSWELYIEGDFPNMYGLSLRHCDLFKKVGNEFVKLTTVVSAIKVSDYEMSISLKDKVKSIWGQSSPTQVYIRVKKYVGGIASLKVLGKHYKTQDNGRDDKQNKYLTITGHYDTETMPLSFSQSLYRLTNAPTQIKSVQVGYSNGGGIVLAQTENRTRLKWSVKKEGKIKRITGGMYYYDVDNCRIEIPLYDKSNSHWSTFEQSNSTGVTYLPNTLFVEYWSGNGATITLPAEAGMPGPSYQLEKGAIQFIDQKSINNFQPNGISCKMIDITGNTVRQQITWECYNSTPAGLSIGDASKTRYTAGYDMGETKSGKFNYGQFTGSELARTSCDKDEDFISLFGENCTRLRGKCVTEMVFVGAPNKVISGNINVYAADKTIKKVQIDKDKNHTVTLYERTGGIRSGILIVKVMPQKSKTNRVTITYGMPKLYIYARERKMTEKV